jgi:hopene-associated glycosyltransferase HpnB
VSALIAFAVPAWLSLVVWICIVFGRGRFWRIDVRLPEPDSVPAPREGTAPEGYWPAVTAVVPARDEAKMLPATLPSVLGQDYPGRLDVIVVDDASADGTSDVAREVAARFPNRMLTVLRTQGPPPGWAGKVAAMNSGLAAASDPLVDHGAGGGEPARYVLFTDADITHPADSVRRLVRQAETDGRDLVSLMALLSTGSAAERAIVPAFVYSFFQLYPPAWVRRPGSATAAAAGGCMLVRREALEKAGGLERISGARIDDVALGTLIKGAAGDGGRSAAQRGRIWLGATDRVLSLRPYPRLADLWDMIARSAYTQLRYSPWLLAGTLFGLLLTYAVPPVFGLVFVAAAVAGGDGRLWAVAAPSLAAWALMSASYLPVLRLYRLSAWRAPLLPGVMMIYGAMTADSARRHRRGRGGSWKGRVEQRAER